MKRTPVQFLLAASLVTSAFFVACQKETIDPALLAEAKGGNGNGNNGRGNGNGGPNGGTNSGTNGGTATVSTRTCYYGQGYWFGSGKRTWPDLNGGTTGVVTIAGQNYTQEQAWSIWKASNKGGLKDAKRAFILLATIQLSGSNAPAYSNMSADIATVSSFLSGLGMLNGSNLASSSMNSAQKAAYNRLKDWLENHSCDDDEDRICNTDVRYWFGSGAHTWGTASLTVGTYSYTTAEAVTVWNTYLNTSNHDAQKLFLFLTAWQLSGTTTTGYSGMATDIAAINTWLQSLGKLTTTNTPTTAMPSNVASAYNRLNDWLKEHDCDEDDD